MLLELFLYNYITDYLKGFFNEKIKFGETTKLLLTEEETLFNQGDEGDKAYMIISED